jgi:hypothetical protein
MILAHFDSQQQRLVILNQRVHHGPLGLSAALLLALDKRLPLPERVSLCVFLALWGLSDWHDAKVWFKPGLQAS